MYIKGKDQKAADHAKEEQRMFPHGCTWLSHQSKSKQPVSLQNPGSVAIYLYGSFLKGPECWS